MKIIHLEIYYPIYIKKSFKFSSVFSTECCFGLSVGFTNDKQKTVVKEGVQYSTYLAYKITAPETDNANALYGRRGYSDFYEKLLVSNLNGAYLFNDVSDKELSQMAKELDTSAVTLKNSNFDYWDKKVVVNYISTNLGVSVKILTPSKLVNDLIEKNLMN
ncbi:hypothetical protein HMPREF9127_1100 [Parvimonas sp. oral taxon 393 str. F0440]|nr:hypothetical protein HMPREF9127_1100 [Parvimonas sp. oral taxon 393 str. F0440]